MKKEGRVASFVPLDVRKNLEVLAAREDRSMSNYVRVVLTEHVKDKMERKGSRL